jgi:hypothetical protein
VSAFLIQVHDGGLAAGIARSQRAPMHQNDRTGLTSDVNEPVPREPAMRPANAD